MKAKSMFEIQSLRLAQVTEYDGVQWVGHFHIWAGLSERPLAVVETGDGDIRVVASEQVKFLDRGEWKKNEYGD